MYGNPTQYIVYGDICSIIKISANTSIILEMGNTGIASLHLIKYT